MTAKLEKWTGWLLVFLALGAFVLSFAGMYAVAVDAGYGWLAWLWPLVTESAVVIFSLILLNAKLDGYVNKYLHPVIIACTALSVAFNIWHAPGADLLTRAVVALPPIFLYTAFKTWIWKVEQDTRRAGLVTTLDTLTKERDRLTAELDTMRGELSQERDRLTQERDNLAGQVDTKRAELDTLNADLDDIIGQIYRLRMDTKADNSGNVQEMTAKRQAEADDRRRQALSMWQEGMSKSDIATALNVTDRTVKRYLNGHGGE